MLTVVDALSSPYPCGCDCFHTLTIDERVQGVTALYRFDDALRGWGYQPIYELAADVLYRKAQAEADPKYRGIAMRDDACVYRRLVGYAVHELIHALEGDTTKANYGIPWGAPYNVPIDLLDGEEAAFLHLHNVGEARAFVGLRPVAVAIFGIDWGVYTARDVGTYGFPGGNAIVPAPRGFRQVPHWDRQHHPREYYARARALEEAERGYFTDEKLREYADRCAAAETRGRMFRKVKFPPAETIARLAPRLPGRNDACICGSGEKFKKCCAPRYGAGR
ncbi:MAG TPA: SEC-C metal-binding domain-containing protein [Polyangia bacterium]|nr:SEC-C metal-binding domain-containing protein [Polyangia bacterium]